LVPPDASINVDEGATLVGNVKLANPTGTTPAYLTVNRTGKHLHRVHVTRRYDMKLTASTFTMTPNTTLLAGLAATWHKGGR
jgi:hypothetical protein